MVLMSKTALKPTDPLWKASLVSQTCTSRSVSRKCYQRVPSTLYSGMPTPLYQL